MKVGVPAEVTSGERRVAATPQSVKRLIEKLGFEVMIESGAGREASLPDDAYKEAGATIVDGPETIWADADIVLKINPPAEHPALGTHEADLAREGQVLISLIWPSDNKPLIDRLNERRVTVIGLDCIPRITRAQKMDVLSSMANIAGYRAVIEAANLYGGFFGLQMTAAGKEPPATVLVIGAGVAGLAALGAAKNLGAQVRAFDVRPAVKEQIQSMGAQFLEVELDESGAGEGGYAKTMSKEFIEAEMALFLAQAPEVDVVISTALIPGKPAPLLWTREHVEAMKPGSIVVDLAASRGGNCEVTVPGEVVQHEGVWIVGHTDLTSRLPTVASRFFANNMVHLLTDMGGAEEWRIDHDDEAVRGALIVQDGAWLWPPPRKPKPAPKPAPAAPAAEPAKAAPAPKRKKAERSKSKKKSHGASHGPPASESSPAARGAVGLVLAVIFTAVGVWAPTEFVQHFTVFVLSCFIGWQLIWAVNHALHTPLMSVTNAISGIILVGGMLQAGSGLYAPTGEMNTAAILGAVAILVASINIAGGFLVTQRMLAMFKKD